MKVSEIPYFHSPLQLKDVRKEKEINHELHGGDSRL
jgi:hypothetical protein